MYIYIYIHRLALSTDIFDIDVYVDVDVDVYTCRHYPQICSLQSTLLCSAFILSALTTDRYLKIVHPFKHERICNDWQPHWVCCSLAVSSCVIGFLPFTGTGHTADANFMMCSYLQVSTT